MTAKFRSPDEMWAFAGDVAAHVEALALERGLTVSDFKVVPVQSKTPGAMGITLGFWPATGRS